VTVGLVLLSLAVGAGAEEEPVFVDGGPYRVEWKPQPCLTREQRRAMHEQILLNRRLLELAGKLQQPIANAPRLSWPIRCRWNVYDCHGISGFVDHDPQYPDSLQDYNCGARTYDTEAGYNHQGTDFFSWPFSWYQMDNDLVEVVAAADGVIIYKADGNFDRSCETNSEPWNAVVVLHADGSYAWYGHLKSGSVLAKDIGEKVTVGEYLGVLGSSGNSTGPHLHFELYTVVNVLRDPFAGPCNTGITSSWWRDQAPYYDSAINMLATHDAPPDFNRCPEQEELNLRNVFAAGEAVYLAAYYRDQLSGQVSVYSVRRPDGSLLTSWEDSSEEEHYAASYWYWYLVLPNDAETGYWRFEVAYEGAVYQHVFAVGDVPEPASPHRRPRHRSIAE